MLTFVKDHLNLDKALTRPARIFRFALILVFIASWHTLQATSSIEEFLSHMPLKNVRVLEKESFYSHIYEVMFEQPIDHRHPEKGSFYQRLYISHTSVDMPVVLVTEGYSAGYYYTSEPAMLLRCNQIIAEHRYFGESVPDSVQWEYLDTWQSASDHHRIVEQFREFYSGKWISTGISKGGQTLMYHSFYYPDDVDVRMPYVAPLNKSVEDKRIYSFLDQVGSKECRKRIYRFQKNALKHQEDLLPAFKNFSEQKGYTYTLAGGYETAFEYCVLEYSFAFWQWGYVPCSEIPGKRASPEEIIVHMNRVAGFDYFADKFVIEYQPFFYQSYTEMGYYGYQLDKFRPYLKHLDRRGFRFALPTDTEVAFNDSTQLALEEYVSNEAENFIFIYGEYDTWSATAVELSGNTNSKIFYKEKGSHRTRVRNMPQKQQDEIFAVLIGFLQE